MHYLTGYTSDGAFVSELKRLGWGRMLCCDGNKIGPPYPGERVGVDNGAFTAWNNCLVWSGLEYLDRLSQIADLCPDPLFSVTPDRVADPDSLRFSLGWVDRMKSLYPRWPWYLALQDGMTPEGVAPVVGRFSGVFLGGTKRWKRRTAKTWAAFAEEHGVRSHYARCSTASDLNHARRCGYHSADSTFLLWTRDRFAAFVREFEGVTPSQGGLDL